MPKYGELEAQILLLKISDASMLVHIFHIISVCVLCILMRCIDNLKKRPLSV